MVSLPFINTRFDYRQSRIFVTYDLTNERYVLACGSEVRFDKVLHDHLVRVGYKIILFLGNRGCYFLDDFSERAVLSPESVDNNDGVPKPVCYGMEKLIKPLAVRKKRVPEAREKCEFLTRSVYRDMAEVANMVPLVERLMTRSEYPTAIVFIDDKIHSSLQSSPLNTRFENFLRTEVKSLSTDNCNILVLNVPERSPVNFLEKRKWDFLLGSDRSCADARAVFVHVGAAESDEIERFIVNSYLTDNLQVDWKNFTTLVNELAGYIKSEQKSLTVLNTIKKLRKLDREVVKEITGQAIRSAGEQLADLIGMNNVKAHLQRKIAGFAALKRPFECVQTDLTDIKRLVPDLPPSWVKTMRLHLVLVGKPGTGKTTVARLIGTIYREAGILPMGHTVKVTRKDLVAEYVGQTAIKTAAAVDKAMGGVLFIDEAYDICRGPEDEFGTEAVTALVEALTERNGQFAAIMAGYPDDIKRLLESNSGLKSRFPEVIEIEDYMPEELKQILLNTLQRLNAPCADQELQENLSLLCEKLYQTRRSDFGNAREMETIAAGLCDNAAGEGSDKLLTSHLPDKYLQLIVSKGVDEKGLTENLRSLIGLDGIKTRLQEIFANLAVEKKRKGKNASLIPGHFIFTGPPGVGKTRVAQIMAEQFFSMGILPFNEIHSTTASSLIKGFVGQSSVATTEFLREGIGRVIFIDEAHQLYSGHPGNSFGLEVIGALVPFAEDNRASCVIILAGYTEAMSRMLSTDPGLLSRFPQKIDFPSYSPAELLNILELMMRNHALNKEPSVDAMLLDFFAIWRKTKDFGNARHIRNFLESCIRKQSIRLNLLGLDGIPEGDAALSLLQKEDFEGAIKEFRSE